MLPCRRPLFMGRSCGCVCVCLLVGECHVLEQGGVCCIHCGGIPADLLPLQEGCVVAVLYGIRPRESLAPVSCPCLFFMLFGCSCSHSNPYSWFSCSCSCSCFSFLLLLFLFLFLFLFFVVIVPVFSLPAVLMRVPVPVLVLGILWSCLCCSWCGRFLVLCRVVGALDVAVVLLCSIPCCLLCCPHALL